MPVKIRPGACIPGSNRRQVNELQVTKAISARKVKYSSGQFMRFFDRIFLRKYGFFIRVIPLTSSDSKYMAEDIMGQFLWCLAAIRHNTPVTIPLAGPAPCTVKLSHLTAGREQAAASAAAQIFIFLSGVVIFLSRFAIPELQLHNILLKKCTTLV